MREYLAGPPSAGEIFSKMNLLLREKQKNQDELIKQTDFNFQLVDNKIEDTDLSCRHAQQFQDNYNNA